MSKKLNKDLIIKYAICSIILGIMFSAFIMLSDELITKPQKKCQNECREMGYGVKESFIDECICDTNTIIIPQETINEMTCWWLGDMCLQ